MSCVLAIDPGRVKCGLAVVDDRGEVLMRAIVPAEELCAAAEEAAQLFQPVAALMGDGTGSERLRRKLQELCPLLGVQFVDEAHTSEAARRRYLREIPPRGWSRWLPRALRTPESAYDDFVAVILAERWWSEQCGPTEKASTDD